MDYGLEVLEICPSEVACKQNPRITRGSNFPGAARFTDWTIRHADPSRQLGSDGVVCFPTKPLKTCFVARCFFVPCPSKQGGQESPGDRCLRPCWHAARCRRYQPAQDCQATLGIVCKIFGARFLNTHDLESICDGIASWP